MKTGKTELNLNEMTNAAGGELHPMLMNDGEKTRSWRRFVTGPGMFTGHSSFAEKRCPETPCRL